jgi:pyridoxal phosphate enzyme (YggS family)
MSTSSHKDILIDMAPAFYILLVMSIKENILRLRARISKAAKRAGRNADEILVVAVTKTVNPARIAEALECGIRAIGENRVQEAKEKFPAIGDRVSWHMVGHLQTNKVRDALKIFSLIHSLDSPRLAREIEKRTEHVVQCLIEVNTSKEASKYGIPAGQLLDFYRQVQEFERIDIQGLMTIGPGWAVQDPEASRSCFRTLRDLRDGLVQAFDRPLPVLSMGMTSDFEVAIEEGSNMIRVGTAIFGERTDKH